MTRIATTIHKWLALLMAVQILFWVASGLVFAIFPIERVRSEHAIAQRQPEPVAINTAAAGLERVASHGFRRADKVEIRTMLGRPVALLSGDARPVLFDLASGRRVSPISAAVAGQIAEDDHAGAARAQRVLRVVENSPEYRGALPAWRVEFDDGANRALYVAADTAVVTARRSTLWRVYDFLWGLHIMDWRGHENFNSPLLVIASVLALAMAIAGILMLPSRLGLNAWLRRRRINRSAAE